MVKEEIRDAMRGGVPTLSDVERIERSDFFSGMRAASDGWLERNAAVLAPYATRWVRDPLRQWSRRWEYPFALHALVEARATKVLDAGSGFTFFPYYVAEKTEADFVCCVDSDDLAGLYAAVEADQQRKVVFRRGDLRDLPVGDGEVDAVCSISVLEHTNAFVQIVAELRRVLAPGGLLVLTFDLSLDGLSDIPIARAKELLNELSEAFEPVDAPRDLERMLNNKRVLNTSSAERDQLPWKHPWVSLVKSASQHRRLPLARMKKLTCYGGVFRRAEVEESPAT